MSVKNVCTFVLLLFVAVSVVVLTVKSLCQSPPSAAAEDPRDRLIVYYFHGKARCPSCMSIEAYAHEAVTGGFTTEVKDGRIEWKVVDFTEPEYAHFVKDFDLAAPSVVLVEMQGGGRKSWKNLPEVWELVGDRPAFVEFVQKEVRAFLDKSKNAQTKTADHTSRDG